MRALLVAALMLGACSFDVSGKATGDDDGVAIDASTGGTIDGAPHAVPDASSLPQTIDAAPANNPPVDCGNETCGGSTICCSTFQGMSCTAPDACGGSTIACDGPDDCPGQQCCMYLGSWTSCADSCFGGETVCGGDGDCDSNSSCCDHGDSPSTCGAFCF